MIDINPLMQSAEEDQLPVYTRTRSQPGSASTLFILDRLFRGLFANHNTLEIVHRSGISYTNSGDFDYDEILVTIKRQM